ncbi:glycosyltransferase [Algoriphagus aestuarii]|nr:glycosyltransferase [Algoriphagus aestuarii]
MLSFYLISVLCYFFLLWRMRSFWPKASKWNSEAKTSISVSLLISVRNEEENLAQLHAAIIDIYDSVLEIIFVDDHSEDETFTQLVGYFQNDPKVQIFSNPGTGKKSAIDYAVSRSKGELMLTTDADCRWDAQWVGAMTKQFQTKDLELVAGPVLSYPGNKFLDGFQMLEWTSILLVSNFSFKIGKPLTCSAANMAFRKSAFLEVHGFRGNEENPSGDDEFLLKKIVAEFGAGSVYYHCSKESLVLTKPEKNWSALIHQKVRWAGKWRSHSSGFHVISSILPIAFQLIWASSFLLLILGNEGFLAFCVLWAFKILGEGLSFGRILRSLEKPISFPDLITTSLIHSFYMLWVAMKVTKGEYIWKGRLNGKEELPVEISTHD